MSDRSVHPPCRRPLRGSWPSLWQSDSGWPASHKGKVQALGSGSDLISHTPSIYLHIDVCSPIQRGRCLFNGGRHDDTICVTVRPHHDNAGLGLASQDNFGSCSSGRAGAEPRGIGKAAGPAPKRLGSTVTAGRIGGSAVARRESRWAGSLARKAASSPAKSSSLPPRKAASSPRETAAPKKLKRTKPKIKVRSEFTRSCLATSYFNRSLSARSRGKTQALE